MEDAMPITQQAVERLLEKLRLTTPVIAVYDAEPGPAFEPMVRSAGGACCFAYYHKWVNGETLVIQRDDRGTFGKPAYGCMGLQSALGFRRSYAPWMANFLTDGNGAPMGEGLKATPALAQEFIDRAKPMDPAGDYMLMGPLKLSEWPSVRSVTLFADPDRLSALMTLASYYSSSPQEILAPFSSGCGLMWRELINLGGGHALIGCTDIAMRRYIPRELLALCVTPDRFEQMVQFPDNSFLDKEWWNALLESRQREDQKTRSAVD